MSTHGPSITILVPTMNRPDFAIRLLRYYDATHFQGAICLADASAAPEAERIGREVAALSGRLTVTHLHLPGCGIAESLQHAGAAASTPFVAFAGDDDFLIPDTLVECAAVLTSDTALSAVHGTGVVAVLAEPGSHGAIQSLQAYPQPVLDHATASERLIWHLAHYSVSLFSVHRTETWRAMFSGVDRIGDITFAAELVPCCLSAVYGKIAQVDQLGVVRQDHVRRVNLPSALDWIAEPQWAASYAAFAEILSHEVARQDRIRTEESDETVKKAFWAYLAKLLRKQWQGRYGHLENPPLAARVRSSAKSRIKSAAARIFGRASALDALRDPSAPDFNSFDPVFKSLDGN